MVKKPAPSVDITCPCCKAKLTVDPELAVVLSHEPPPKGPPSVDLDDTAAMLQKQADAREEKFRKSVEAEKKKEEVFDRLFEEGLKKAKDQPIEKPIRDFDLD